MIKFVNSFYKEIEGFNENEREELGFLIKWEIELDILHKESEQLDRFIYEYDKSKCDFSSVEKMNLFVEEVKKAFSNECLLPLVNKKMNLFKNSVLNDYIGNPIPEIIEQSDSINNLFNHNSYTDNNEEEMIKLFDSLL